MKNIKTKWESGLNYIFQIIALDFTQFKALVKGQGFIKNSETALQAWNQIDIGRTLSFSIY
jgi:hypothetical protein